MDPKSRIEKLTSSSSYPPVILVEAKEEIRAKRAVETILTKVLGKGYDHSEIYSANGAELKKDDLSKIELEIFSISLFSKTQTLHIHNGGKIRKEVEKSLAELLGRSPEECVAIVSAPKFLKSSPLRKLAEKHQAIISLPELKGAALKRWLQSELKLAGISDASAAALETLIQVSDSDVDEMTRSVEHLSLYLEESGKLETSDVLKLFPAHPDPNEFHLMDAISRGRLEDVERLITTLLDTGKSPFALLALLGRGFQTLQTIRSLAEQGVSTQDIRHKIGASSWVFRKHLETLGCYRKSKTKLNSAMERIAATDLMLKDKSTGPASVLSELAWSLSPRV